MSLKLNKCPYCHNPIDVFMLVRDEATSQLLVKMAKLDTLTGNAMMDYLTLFSPAKTALTASKALRIVAEVEGLANGDMARMALAMATTVDGIRTKQHAGETIKPFTTHNYLKKVLEQTSSGIANQVVAPLGGQPKIAGQIGQSKTFGALSILEGMKHE